jgi:hypothetical protein
LKLSDKVIYADSDTSYDEVVGTSQGLPDPLFGAEDETKY